MAARELFLDASYLIALGVPADEHHNKARDIFLKLERSGPKLVTTQAVLFEVGDALCKPRQREAAVSLLDALARDPNVTLIGVDEALYARGLELFRQRRDKDWGLTDCISFVVMKERGITEALTTDEHFVQAGFNALLRQ